MYPNRPIWAEVDLRAIRANFLALRELTGRGVRIMAVIKSDAYGHGKLEVAQTLHGYADWFGVSFVDEGVELRQAGFDEPILVMVTPLPDELEMVIKYRLTPVISDLERARSLSERLERRGWLGAGRESFPVHMKVDTGMGRLGVWHEEAPEVIAAVTALPGLRLEGVMTHFPASDAEDLSFAREQLARFERVLSRLAERGVRPELRHTANSAAVAALPESRLDLVRPGLALYGAYPSAEARRNLVLQPAMTLRARIAVVKTLPAGTTVSYGRRHRLERETPVGVLPLGYADGWRHNLEGRAEAVVRGRRRPLIGALCMDMCMLDLSDLEDVQPGEVVTLMGRDYSGQEIRVEKVAGWMETIPYEVTCGLSARVPRHYLRTG